MLLSEETTTRAISLESVTRVPEPFPLDSPVKWGADGRTRVEVYAMNLALQPGEGASAVTAGAEDASGPRYELRAEFVGPVPGFEWMTAVVLRLSDDLADVGDVLVRVSYHGMTSNRVRLGIGHVGGGPPDDPGAVPTPPRFVGGRVTQDGSGLGGVSIVLSGSQTATLTTAADGSYSFVAAPLGDYTLTPQTVFSLEGNFLSYYFRPGDPLSDLSGGYGGQPHPGLRRGTLNGYIFGCDGCPVPQFVVDSTAPDFSNPSNPGQTPAPTPAPGGVPQGALVFDSFNRRHSTHILGGAGGLGKTEGGSAGPLAWRTNVEAPKPQPFGILNGRAVLLSNATAVAWVDAGGAKDVDIRVDRLPRTWGSGQNTGLSFRVADASNYFFAYTSEGNDQADPKTLTVGYYLGGVRTELVTGVSLPNPQSPWLTLRVLTKADGTLQVIADGALVYSTTSSLLSNATGAGLYNKAPGLGLTNRWDNFTVFALQQ